MTVLREKSFNTCGCQNQGLQQVRQGDDAPHYVSPVHQDQPMDLGEMGERVVSDWMGVTSPHLTDRTGPDPTRPLPPCRCTSAWTMRSMTVSKVSSG